MSDSPQPPADNSALLSAILAELKRPGADVRRVLAQHRTAQQPQAVQEMLRRASLPRRFDEALYREVLCDGIDAGAPAFEAFVDLPEIQRLPRDAGFRLRDDARNLLRKAWRRDDLSAWQAWHQRFADYLRDRRPDDAAGRLYHLVLAQAPEAVTFFTGAFDAADARFDLARCFSLLAVLDEVQEDLGQPLAAARLIKQQRYGGRALFASDYYRANVYQERPGSREAADAVMDPQGAKWILHIFATGGMGKTAFLRWLIARQLVPAGIACARVDFDLVNAANVAISPWLLLMPLGEQLNAQLPRQYFTELLNELRTWQPLLDPPKSAAPIYQGDRLSSSSGAIALTKIATERALPDRATTDRFVRQFASILCEANAPALLVLDTLESLTRADQIVPVYKLLDDLHARAPHLRCIVAGRYCIPTKFATEAVAVDQFVGDFSANAVIHEVARFTDDEARRYLRGRGVTDEAIIEAIVRKVRQPERDGQAAGTNPFTLALVTELVLGRDASGLSRKDIEDLPSARFVYLVDRVVRRIPDQPLRWVVRYGALPRRLTPAYIEAVLLDPLKRALRGELVEDQLGPRRSATGVIPEQDVWQIDRDAQPTTAGLWTALCAYESPRGWIWRAPGGAEAIQFHGDVVDPMRDLLSHQSVFRTLQQASIAYFEQLAREDPARWADWTCEAIFHTFQLEGDKGAAYWRRQLDAPQAKGDPQVRRQIAREVLRREYAEDEQTPVRREASPSERTDADPTGIAAAGAPIIEKGTLAHAHVETARAILAVAGYVSTIDPDWLDLKQHVRLAQLLAREAVDEEKVTHATATTVDDVVLASVEAAECTAAGKHDEAAALLAATLARATEGDARFSLEYQLADALATLRQPEASAHYREAIRLHRSRGRTGVRLADLQIKLASWYQSEGYHLNARDVLNEAYAAASDDPALHSELALQLAWSAIKAGDYDRAQTLLGAGPWPTNTRQSAQPAVLRLGGWFRLATEDPRKAEAYAQWALRDAATTEDEARALDLLGRTYAELMRFADAAGYWERAIPLFTRTTAPFAVESCLIDQIALHTRVTGNFKEAAALIAQAERLPGIRDAEIACRVETEKLFVQVHADQGGAAQETLARLLAPKTPAWPAALRARIMAAGFALDLLKPNDVTLMAFWETLDEIRPASARTDIADLLRMRIAPLTESTYWRQRFLSLFPVADPKKDSFVARALRAAEVHRLFDSPTAARTLLTSALERLTSTQNPWGAIRALEGLEKLDAPAASLPASALPSSALASSGSPSSALTAAVLPSASLPSTSPNFASTGCPFADAIATLHRLDAMLEAAATTGTIDATTWDVCLNEAETGLATEHTRTRWHARLAEIKARHVRRTGGDWGSLQAHVIGAIDAYRALGDTLAEQRIQQEMPLFQSAPPAPPRLESPEPPPRMQPPASQSAPPMPSPAIAIVRPTDELIAKQPTASPQTEDYFLTSAMSPDSASLRPPSDAAREAFAGYEQLSVSALAERLQGTQAVAELDALLTTGCGVDPMRAEAPLILPRGTPSMLPWEWTRPAQFLWRTRASASPVTPELTRWIQRALNRCGATLHADGIYGPATVSAMTRFAKDEKLPVGLRPTLARLRTLAAPEAGGTSAPILVVAPREFGYDADEAALSASTGVGPAQVYHVFGGHTGVEILREPTLPEFQEAMRRLTPSVVHLVCTLTEISGLTHIGFSRRDQSSELMAAPTLHRLLMTNGSIAPFLVLDVARPSSTWEAIACLLRRNQFATDLFYLEGLPGILATGIAQPFQALRLEQRIASLLVPGTSMRELVTALRGEVNTHEKPVDHLLAFTGAALFTAEPELPCLQT
jgi:hypothetical protein